MNCIRRLSVACPLLLLGCLVSGCPESRPPGDDGGRPGVDAPFAPPDGATVDSGPCVTGFTSCGGTCVRTSADDTNCGTCGNVCPAGSSCAAGSCTCMEPMLACDGVCLDPSRDRMHCGSCENACPSGQMCTRGACVERCDGPGRLTCFRDEGGTMVPFCADLNTDEENCGRCGTSCGPGATCNGGACVCPTGETFCSMTGCVDLLTDPENCGECELSCGPGGTCDGGRCVGCGPGLELCGLPTQCVDVATSSAHCGMCDRPCATGETCTGGLCDCLGAGRIDCGLGCLDPMTNRRNCGGCGIDCGTGGVCMAGTCRCAAGLTMCGPECADLMRDREHCGTCAISCGDGMACQAGTCVLADSFRVVSFDASGCQTIDQSIAGDDRGGVAVSGSTFFVTGDSSTVRMSAADLSGLATGTVVHDGMVSDLESETIYVLMNGPTEVSGGFGSATQLGVLDGTTGVLTATRIPLSASIPLTYGTAIMSGYAEALVGVPLGGNLQWYRIDFPDGTVTTMATTSMPTHRSCENWAWWGIAERIDDVRYATYVEDTTAIVRLPIPESGTSFAPADLVSSFTNLGDMCSIGFSTSRNRWYFHHEYDSEFSPSTFGGEIAGYCTASWDRP